MILSQKPLPSSSHGCQIGSIRGFEVSVVFREQGIDVGQVLIFLSNLRTVPRARLSC